MSWDCLGNLLFNPVLTDNWFWRLETQADSDPKYNYEKPNIM